MRCGDESGLDSGGGCDGVQYRLDGEVVCSWCGGDERGWVEW